MKFTQVPVNTFKQMQLNAGVLASHFDPSTGTLLRSNILGATSGGLQFNDSPTFEDFGDDVDNVPKNSKELKKLTGRDVNISGTLVTTTVASAKRMIGAADIDVSDATHIIPRRDLEASDFQTLWWIGDYSDKNGNTNGGYIAIKMTNTLSTGGFSIKSNDKGKGQFAFTYTAHTSLDNPDVVPYDVYIQEGDPEPGGYEIMVGSVASSSNTGKTVIDTNYSLGSGESWLYQTGISVPMPSEGSLIAGSAWTEWDGDDEISSTTGLEIVVVVVNASNISVHAGKTIVTVKES